MSLKIEFKNLQMEPFIVLNKEYNVNRPSYVTSIAVSSSCFDKTCVHKSEKIYNFYKDDKNYEIVFVKDGFEHNHFKNLIDKLKKDKDQFESEYNRTVLALNTLNEALCG